MHNSKKPKVEVEKAPICKQCLTTKSKLDLGEGEFRWWCLNCEGPFIKPEP